MNNFPLTKDIQYYIHLDFFQKGKYMKKKVNICIIKYNEENRMEN